MRLPCSCTSHLPEVPLDRLVNPAYTILPRYWIRENEVNKAQGDWERDWMYGLRGITYSTNERTTISSVLPKSGLGNSVMFIASNLAPYAALTSLAANFNCIALDYVSRQKLGGTNYNQYVIKQLPIIPPHTYVPVLLNFIALRVLELTYTAWDLQPFAQDVGYDGAPFIWDEERRFLMRCELDALYFHLYEISRDDVDYIMETFPIVKRKDEAAHGEYLTKRIILEMYDQMAALLKIAVPAPKDEHSTYDVPNVGQWQTWLSPPPADSSVAHPDDRE